MTNAIRSITFIINTEIIELSSIQPYHSSLLTWRRIDSHDLFQFIFINKFIMQSEEEEVTVLLKKIEQQD